MCSTLPGNLHRNLIQLALLDDRQHPLYDERLFQGQFRRSYDLSQLAGGSYTLVVTHNQKPHTFRISVHHPLSATYGVEPKTPGTLAGVLTDEN